MAFNIPSGIFSSYYEVCDEFLNNNFIGKSCTIVYPPKREDCVCTLNPQGYGTGNVFSHGGPAPKAFNDCVYCGGNGYRETEVTETIRLRTYFNKKDWIKVGNLAVNDAECMVIGFMSDINKVKNAKHILLINEQTTTEFRYILAGEPAPHGFGRSRYFTAFLKRA